ncbi:MAG: Flp pilus assembly protein CpaB [Deltaproteobacteria bacterium]|jgi:Flp pilus assembly protein CpaB|nr:Flp pilus assembly protein CpaB [Deltaproteobacteria bacterium]
MTSLFRRKPVIVSTIAAVVAMTLSAGYLKAREHKLLKMSELINVVKAKTNIRAGDLIADGAIFVDRMPRHFAEPGCYSEVEEVLGRISAVDILADSQLSVSDLRGDQVPGGVAALIPSGKRTLTLVFDDPSGTLGIIKPGDKLDIFATFDLGREVASRKTTLVLTQGVDVIAVSGKVYDASIENFGVTASNSLFGGKIKSPYKRMETILTLAAEQKTIQKIIFAKNYGNLSIALCPFGFNDDLTPAIPVTISTITGKYDELLPMKKNYREYRGR